MSLNEIESWVRWGVYVIELAVFGLLIVELVRRTIRWGPLELALTLLVATVPITFGYLTVTRIWGRVFGVWGLLAVEAVLIAIALFGAWQVRKLPKRPVGWPGRRLERNGGTR